MDVKVPYVVGGVAAGGLVALFSRVLKNFSAANFPEVPGPPILNKPGDIYRGPPGDPEVQALLAEMAAYFSSVGAPPVFPLIDLVYLPKAPANKKVAIPPRHLWPRMAALLYYVVAPLQSAVPSLYVTSGYRPPWYNDNYALGKTQSQHQYFAALDLKARAWSDVFPLTAARIYKANGENLRMGLGIYGSKGTRVHVDVGYQRRVWENAASWVSRV